jgi:hypothetical protein
VTASADVRDDLAAVVTLDDYEPSPEIEELLADDAQRYAQMGYGSRKVAGRSRLRSVTRSP